MVPHRMVGPQPQNSQQWSLGALCVCVCCVCMYVWHVCMYVCCVCGCIWCVPRNSWDKRTVCLFNAHVHFLCYEFCFSVIFVTKVIVLWWFRVERICLQCRRLGFDPWVRKILWGREWLPTQYSCLGNPMDRRVWQATVHGGRKESDIKQ